MDYSRNVKLLGWHSFFIGFSLWAPIAILYFSRVSGSYTLGLSVFSVTMVSSAAFEVPTGVWSDFVGRRKTLIAGAAAYTLSAIFYAIGHLYGILIIGALLEGLARALYSGNNTALLYESLDKSDNKKSLEHFLGAIGSYEQWALAASALLGGIIASRSFGLVMWLSVLPQMICLSLAIATIEVPRDHISSNIYSHTKEAIRLFIKNRKLRLLSMASIIGFGIGEASFQFRSAFVATLWPLWAIGGAQLLSNIGAALSFQMADKLIKKFSAETLLLAGNVYSRMVYFIALLFPSIISPALMSTTSIFYGVGEVAKNSLFQKEFSSEQRATMGSLNSLAGSLFFGIFALLLGAVADKVGPTRAILGATAAQLSTTWIYWKINQKTVRPQEG